MEMSLQQRRAGENDESSIALKKILHTYGCIMKVVM